MFIGLDTNIFVMGNFNPTISLLMVIVANGCSEEPGGFTTKGVGFFFIGYRYYN